MVTASSGLPATASLLCSGTPRCGAAADRRIGRRRAPRLRRSRCLSALLITAAAFAVPACSSETASSQAASSQIAPSQIASSQIGSSQAASSQAASSQIASQPATTPAPVVDTGASGVGTDQEITFTAGQVTVHGSLRLPPNAATPVPAAVLLAGSGPTDRNGNTPAVPGAIDTLRSLADVLATLGVASIRYDKLSTGATGLGPYASDPASIGYRDFVDEARGALGFLAARTDVDAGHLMILGHSEGALIALSVATDPAPGQPRVAGIGLLESLGSRYLDLMSSQLTGTLPALVAAGRVSASDADNATQALPDAISTLRSTGSFPADLPVLLQRSGLSAANAHFLYQADQADPVQLAAALPPGLPVLTTCSQADHQVPCSEMAKLDAALPAATLTPVTLTTADHLLKDEPPGTSVTSVSDLAFSAELPPALSSWLSTVVG